MVKGHTRKPKRTVDELTEGLPVEKIILDLAEEYTGTSAAGRAELSVADGGVENRPAEGDSKGQDKGFILNKSWTICGIYGIILS